MALAQRRWAADILHFWFHELVPRDWWGGSDHIDEMCRQRFGRELDMLASQPAAPFPTTPQMALASVLLFDQMPRNIFRGTPDAFAFDPLAAGIAHIALDRGFADALPARHVQFLAMPLMHSEAMDDQLRSLEVFRRINGGRNLAFARSHFRMIARFGRFPHRNAILDRTTTGAEQRAIDAGFAW